MGRSRGFSWLSKAAISRGRCSWPQNTGSLKSAPAGTSQAGVLGRTLESQGGGRQRLLCQPLRVGREVSQGDHEYREEGRRDGTPAQERGGGPSACQDMFSRARGGKFPWILSRGARKVGPSPGKGGLSLPPERHRCFSRGLNEGRDGL